MKDPLVLCSVEWSNSCLIMLGNHAPGGEPVRMDGWMDGWMMMVNSSVPAWLDGWMDGWMDKWMDGWVDF